MGVILTAILLWLIDSNEAYTIVVMQLSDGSVFDLILIDRGRRNIPPSYGGFMCVK